jgi:hypothetical protein
VNGGTAFADWDGAIAMYISWHSAPIGSVIAVNTEKVPSQLILSMFLLFELGRMQKSLEYRSVCEAATPTGPLGGTVGMMSGLKKTYGVP